VKRGEREGRFAKTSKKGGLLSLALFWTTRADMRKRGESVLRTGNGQRNVIRAGRVRGFKPTECRATGKSTGHLRRGLKEGLRYSGTNGMYLGPQCESYSTTKGFDRGIPDIWKENLIEIVDGNGTGKKAKRSGSEKEKAFPI